MPFWHPNLLVADSNPLHLSPTQAAVLKMQNTIDEDSSSDSPYNGPSVADTPGPVLDGLVAYHTGQINLELRTIAIASPLSR